MQEFIAEFVEQERWQFLLRVRLIRQVKDYTGIERDRQPVPEYLTQRTLPSCLTHRLHFSPVIAGLVPL